MLFCRYGSSRIYRFDERPPFVLHLASRRMKPACSRSFKARHTVLRERLRASAMVAVDGKQDLSLFALFLRYIYTATARLGRSAA